MDDGANQPGGAGKLPDAGICPAAALARRARFLPLRFGCVRISSTHFAAYSEKPIERARAASASTCNRAANSFGGSHSPRAIFVCTEASHVRASVFVKNVNGLSSSVRAE